MARKRAVNGSGLQPRLRKDGRWECRYQTGINPGTGKAIYKSAYGRTAEECAKKLRAATAEIDKGTYIDPPQMTLSQWLEVWQAEYLVDIKQSTLSQYASYIKNHIKPGLGGIKLAALKPHTIQIFYNKVLKSDRNPNGISAKSVKNLHGILHSALKQAVTLGYLPSNPADACILPRIEKSEVSFLQNDEIRSFLEAIKGHPFETIYKIDLFTGMRQGEILGLTWNCVDFENGIITVEKQLQKEHFKDGKYMLVSNKNDRVRRIIPASFVIELLKQRQKEQKAHQLLAGALWDNPWNLVFTNELGSHLCAYTVYKHFKKIATNIGMPHARFHDLRHTYAMLSLQNGDDVKTVQHNVGHASAAFTLDVYGHVSTQMQKESASRMQNFFENVNTTAKANCGQNHGQPTGKNEKSLENTEFSRLLAGGAGGIRIIYGFFFCVLFCSFTSHFPLK